MDGAHQAWGHDWTVAPGEILVEALDDRAMSRSELARRVGCSTTMIDDIVAGEVAITDGMALRLEQALGISARLWRGLAALHSRDRT